MIDKYKLTCLDTVSMNKGSLKDSEFTVLTNDYSFFQRLFLSIKLLFRCCLPHRNPKQIKYRNHALLCNTS